MFVFKCWGKVYDVGCVVVFFVLDWVGYIIG